MFSILVFCHGTFGFWANNPTQTDHFVGQQRALNLDSSLRDIVNFVLYVEIHFYILANMHKNNSQMYILTKIRHTHITRRKWMCSYLTKIKKYVQLTPIIRTISSINYFHARFHFFSYRFAFCFQKIYIFIQKPGQACCLESPFQSLLECLLNNVMNLGFLLEPSHQHIAGSHPVKSKIPNNKL